MPRDQSRKMIVGCGKISLVSQVHKLSSPSSLYYAYFVKYLQYNQVDSGDN